MAAVVSIDEVVESEPAWDGGPQRCAIEDQPVSGFVEGLADTAGGVSGVAEDVQSPVLVGKQIQADGGLVVLGAGAGPQDDGAI